MHELELRHLRVIIAVADAGSLSKAAVQLGISQPALTAQLQRLERRVGGLLFARSGTGVVPTDLGSYALSAARLVLTDVDEMMAGLKQRIQAVTVAGMIRVGGPPGLIVPLFATAIAERLGNVETAMYIESTPVELARKVLDGKVDFAILEENPGFRTPLPAQLHSQVMISAPMFVAVSDTHRLAGVGDIDLRELADENWVLPPVGEVPEQLALLRACAGSGFTPKIKHQVSDSATTRALVQAGAVTLAKPVVREGPGLVIRNIAGTPLRQEIVLIWHEETTVAATAEQARIALLEAYSKLVGTNPLFAAWWAEHKDAPAEEASRTAGFRSSGESPLMG
ncbi:DNA-binding transcriptional regulator, LysR family [Actinokineospora alba]|uniref:DNA-binding transcriptional regulator, LysR family n=1 Tax=Actinokineospora alba TaxID=504798 RepID=A0A1H0LRZ3_9PSEU|nr:LysR family transcriptional regulator [Actinokineospora alba]TDP67422.1 DNA-binding transcriptional LysR family regulator [Actinokineospora alba]SDI97182.1 DNA-binding transcriptional regulator, LysR family [Actinokineospora alba]SDO70660.1 DNA-binding transcriptional regulator, LysR family [Actinokineospora alba]